MRTAQDHQGRAVAQAYELLDAISAAETVIVTTIERECEALRAGRMLAAQALHTRLCDAVKLYLGAMKSARASLWTIERLVPGSRDLLEERREAFAATMKVELAVLAAERAAVGDHAPTTSFTGESLFGTGTAKQPIEPPPAPPMPPATLPECRVDPPLTRRGSPAPRRATR